MTKRETEELNARKRVQKRDGQETLKAGRENR